MLLDAHGGAVAAGGHGLYVRRRFGAALLCPRRRRWLCEGCEAMGLLLLPVAAGRPLGERCSRPGRLLCCGVSEELLLFVYDARRSIDGRPS